MNNILFIALIVAALYYFYTQRKKMVNHAPNPLLTELQSQIHQLQQDDQLNQQTILSLQEEVATKEQEIERLKTNHPVQSELNEVASTITQLIQQMKQLNQSLN